MIAETVARAVRAGDCGVAALMDEDAWSGMEVGAANTRVDSGARSAAEFVDRVLAVAEASADRDAYAARRRRLLRELESGPQPVDTLLGEKAVERIHARRIVDQLVADGLILRTSAYGDIGMAHITDAGRRALRATRRLQMELIARLLDDAAGDNGSKADETWNTLRCALGSSER